MAEITKDWKLYEAGIKYNNALLGDKKNYYDVIDANIAFASGDQWRNVKGDNLPKPVFNIIKRVKQFKIASLRSSNVAVSINPMEFRIDDERYKEESKKISLANAEIKNVLEKVKFDTLSRELLSDGFDTGDFCLHWYFDMSEQPFKVREPDIKGTISCEIIDSTNIMFGNPNINKVEKQPYILIVGRERIAELKKEAKENGKEIEIEADNETNHLMGDLNKIEIENEEDGKTLYIIKYYKEKGKIYANKSTKTAIIYEKKDTGLSKYPVAFSNWETMKGSYHGRAETTGIIPNQISINKMFAMVIYHLMMTAFPVAVYDSEKIEEWTNQIGTQIPVSGLGNNSIRNVAGYLEPSVMSGQIISAIELMMQYTKETLGVGDASLGNVTMNNASALIALQKSNAVPLENIRANFYQFVEDCGEIIVDMMASKYGIRPVVINNNEEGNIEYFDFNKLKDLWVNIKADVGESSYFSEIASLQTLDNLLSAGLIEFTEYLKRIPSELIPQKEELIKNIQSGDNYHQALFKLMGDFIQGLPPEEQARLQGLPPEEMEKEVLNMMGALTNEQPVEETNYQPEYIEEPNEKLEEKIGEIINE